MPVPHPAHRIPGRGRRSAATDPGPTEEHLLGVGDPSGGEEAGTQREIAGPHGVDVIGDNLDPADTADAEHGQGRDATAAARDQRAGVGRHLHG